MDELMTASVAPPKFRTVLVTIFAFVGLLLAAIGIYGVMAYAVTERTHELGVRIALGADRGDVLRLVLGEAIALAAAGVAAGPGGRVRGDAADSEPAVRRDDDRRGDVRGHQRAARRDGARGELRPGAPRAARRPDGRAAIRIGQMRHGGRLRQAEAGRQGASA